MTSDGLEKVAVEDVEAASVVAAEAAGRSVKEIQPQN
jgi:hypothetical protein